MKKANIITLNRYKNYGNRLQNYSLTKVLRSLSIEVTTPWNRGIKETIKTKLKHLPLISNSFKKEEKLFQFTRKYNKTAIPKKRLDYIIYGSDQVCSPYCIAHNYNLIAHPHGRSGKQISYAASMGVSELSEGQKQLYRESLKGYSAISVREQSAKELLQPLTNKKIEVVLDPTLLLDEREYVALEQKPQDLNNSDKYILCYILGNREQQSIIEKYAAENSLRVIVFSDKRDSDYGVEEFLYLIHHAELICTDSFHACVFSFIFERPFIVFRRTGEADYMYTRIRNFIDTFKLKNREFSGKEITKRNLEIDYTVSKEILKEEKRKSLDYLKRALGINNEN